jgi:hypothetical protein
LPYKDREKRAAHAKRYGKSWYQRNRQVTLERTSRRKKEQRRKWAEFKATLSCLFCDATHPAIIEFHHPETAGETKVSQLVQQGSFKKAYAEAEKCLPLCANCHRIYHWTEREGERDE